MVKLKLTLKSGRPSTVYAANGKRYRLQPGPNTLELEYSDYLALAKSLGIRPVEDKKNEEPKNSEPAKEEPKTNESPAESADKEQENHSDKAECAEKAEKQAQEAEPAPLGDAEEDKEDENIASEKKSDEEVDYSTWSTTKLKAEYKKITGKTCKLKKDEIVAFLQEHNNNA